MQIDIKYSLKECLAALVLFICLAGTFKVGILEILHSFSHHFKAGHSYHSHHTHDENSDHEHIILNVANAVFEEISDSPDLQNKKPKFSFDKITLFCFTPDPQITPGSLNKKSISIYNLQLLPTPFLEIILPPPDFTV